MDEQTAAIALRNFLMTLGDLPQSGGQSAGNQAGDIHLNWREVS
jgi:hypothetical protein